MLLYLCFFFLFVFRKSLDIRVIFNLDNTYKYIFKDVHFLLSISLFWQYTKFEGYRFTKVQRLSAESHLCVTLDCTCRFVCIIACHTGEIKFKLKACGWYMRVTYS